MLRSIGSVTFLALFMVGCGGGGGTSGGGTSGGGTSGASSPPPPPIEYTLGGTVTGLSGSGLVLNWNDGFNGGLAVSASGLFKFSTPLPDGTAFNVRVLSQPTSSPAQYCQVANGAGTIAAANVTNVDITCASGYTVGGTVSGLVGSGLTLATCTPVRQHLGSEFPPSCPRPLQVAANGVFTLDSAYPAGYSGPDFVSITQQPSSPAQNCVLSTTTISIQTANDTGITVSCTEYAYVTNAADNTLSSYSVDATTGALTAVGTPTPTGKSPNAIVGLDIGESLGGWLNLSAAKRYVYVGNEISNDVSAFAVNPATGSLTAVGSPFPAGTGPKAMAFYGALSKSLYIANVGSDNVTAYNIDVSTGALIGPPSNTATGMGPTSVVVGPINQYIYVANHGGSNDISAFDTNGTAAHGSPFPAGGNPLSLALGAGGKFLYSANPDATDPSISGFSIDLAGPLTPLSGSPFHLPVSHYIATDQTGAYLYVTTGVNIVGYAIDATTGALTQLPGFPLTVGVDAYSITVDPTNRFLYVTDDGAANIKGFRLDASTGALTPMSGPPFPAGKNPEFIATF
jgi:6-phosphogluconolactonase